MESAMRTRPTVIAILLSLGAPAAAEPPVKRPPAQSAPIAQQQRDGIVLASAADAHAPAPAEAQSPAVPAKRRIGRVTTCRCGDPQVETDTQEQDAPY
jgi:hypothetical protein